MTSPYDQLDTQIKQLLRQGCTQNQVLQQLITNYPQLVHQAAQVLKRIQAVERKFR